MKKGRLVFCAAALLALVLGGCGKTVQEAAVLEPEPEVIEATVVLAEETSPVEPEPEEIPEPEPLPEGAEILLFGARVSTLTDGQTLFVDCALLEEFAGVDIASADDAVTLGFDGQETVVSLVRSDELHAGDGFLQDGAAYVPLEAILELPGVVSGEAEDGTMYFARKLTLDPPAENVNVPVLMYHAVSDDLWGYSSHLINECQRKGFTPYTVCQCYDTPMTMQLVQAGFGISYLPRSIVETHPGSNIYSKPLVGLPAKSYPTLLWSSNIYYANCVKRFISMFGYPT